MTDATDERLREELAAATLERERAAEVHQVTTKALASVRGEQQAAINNATREQREGMKYAERWRDLFDRSIAEIRGDEVTAGGLADLQAMYLDKMHWWSFFLDGSMKGLQERIDEITPPIRAEWEPHISAGEARVIAAAKTKSEAEDAEQAALQALQDHRNPPPTGGEYDDDLEYIGTAVTLGGILVWHIFEPSMAEAD